MGCSPELLKGIEAMGFARPTPVQEKVIPTVFETENDIVGLAQTGTGKTAAFGLPLIQQTDLRDKSVQTLILAPTRELCIQITKDLNNYSGHVKGLNIIPVYGGANIETQIRALKKGAHIIAATPGRMLDLIRRKAADISNIKTVVLDEADEMLNMGFREELDSILSETPAAKRTLLFSATMPKEVAGMAKRYLDRPVNITIGKQNTGAENVRHYFYLIKGRDRYPALKRIVDINPEIYGIIFCRTRMETKNVADKLIQDGYNAEALHGDLSQAQRDHVMKRFRERSLQLLVATDVAARGIDVDSISHVINYNLPEALDMYTHRSGRTGRADKSGISIVIANNNDKGKIPRIEKIIHKKFEQLPLPTGEEICRKQLFNLIDKMENTEVDEAQIAPFMETVNKKLEWLSKEEIIKKFVSLEFNRILDYYKNAPDLNNKKKEKPNRQNNNKPDRKARKNDKKNGYNRFFIDIGKKDGADPVTIIGLINKNSKTRNIGIGDIDIKNSFSFFEVEDKHSDTVLKHLPGKSFNKRQIRVEVAEKKRAKDKKNEKPV
jgi:ATP-dependent RNA helicase DeaD